MDVPFADRRAGGRALADAVAALGLDDPVVLGVPRGGVPVAAEVARRLHAPLDVVLVRKLGVPAQRELAMGAVGEGGVRVLNPQVLRAAEVDARSLAAVEQEERAALGHRSALLRDGRDRVPVGGRTVVVVDDGVATGASLVVACRVARAGGAAQVVAATPVGPLDSPEALARAADHVLVVARPDPFGAVGFWYDDFTPTTDEEVVDLLAAHTVHTTHTAHAVHVAATPLDGVRAWPGALDRGGPPRQSSGS